MISRELKVREVMKILLGDIGCLERTQPNFQDFIKDKLLDGAEPINARKDLAVCRFLENLQTSLEAIEVREETGWFARASVGSCSFGGMQERGNRVKRYLLFTVA